jgi:hypothetical protein
LYSDFHQDFELPGTKTVRMNEMIPAQADEKEEKLL